MLSTKGLNSDQAVDLLKFFSQTHRSLHDQRRKYEVQAFFTTLTFFAIVGASPFIERVHLPERNLSFSVMVWLAIASIAAASIIYLREIHKANQVNKELAESAENQIRRLVGVRARTAHKPPRSSPPTFYWQSAMIIAFGLGAALLLTFFPPVLNQAAKPLPDPQVVPERAAQPAGKGMELYSWKPIGKDWHFSLLIGTNRNKTMAEIKDPQYTVEGTKAIEEKLSKLAKGECVTWSNLAEGVVPKQIADEITRKCKTLEIRLQGPLTPRARPNNHEPGN